MPKLSSPEIMVFFIQIAVMLFLGKILGDLAKRFKQPSVVGELLAGILLGPTILGTLIPQWHHFLFGGSKGELLALDGFIAFAVVMLLFVVGLEVNLQQVKQQGKPVAYLRTCPKSPHLLKTGNNFRHFKCLIQQI